MIGRRTFLAGSAALGAAGMFGVTSAGARETARIMVGFLPGGLTDVVARLLAQGLNEVRFDYDVIVENRPGASGRIATMAVKQGEADGLTLLFTGSNALSLGPHVFSNVEFDPFVDFVAVNSAISFNYCFSIGPVVPQEIKTLKDYLAWAKENPDLATYAGVLGAPQNLLTGQLGKTAGVELTLAAFKGGGPQMTQDLLRGDIPAATQVVADVIQWQGPDKLRTLAVFAAERSPYIPDVPTIGEAGYPELVAEEWMGLFAPKGTPQPIIDKWAAAVQQVVKQPSFAEGLKSQAALPNGADGAATAAALKSDWDFWKKAVDATGIRLPD